MSKLGSIHLKYGDFTQAINLQSRAALIFRELLGEVHPQVAFSYTSLAMYYHSVGNFEKAFNLMYRALAILELVCGQDHPDIAQIYVNMGHMYAEIGQLQACEDSYLKALYRYIEMFNENHLQVALVYQFLGSAKSSGNFRKALEYQEQCHKILEVVFADKQDHPILANSKLRIQQLTQLSVEQEKQKNNSGREVGSNSVGKMMHAMNQNLIQLPEIKARLEGKKDEAKSKE